jgi:hypothetical protein
MIYEVRTYDLKPHSVPEVEQRFGEAYEQRKKHSPLAAFWHTEIGPLNQIIHVWGYKDLEERGRIRAAAVKDGSWPPKIKEFLVSQRADIMTPLSMSPELKPAKVGPYFEMRTYTLANSGELPKLHKLWEVGIPERTKLSPLCAAWISELGGLNKFIHIWPYKSIDERNQVRDRAKAAGVWPPSLLSKKLGLPGYEMVAQENKILMPSAFSPIQ